jgi:hypothetical protein
MSMTDLTFTDMINLLSNSYSWDAMMDGWMSDVSAAHPSQPIHLNFNHDHEKTRFTSVTPLIVAFNSRYPSSSFCENYFKITIIGCYNNF